MTTDILSLNDIDGRTRFARRARALAREFIGALGGNPAPHELILVRSASELTAIAEKTRAALLAGGAVTLNDVVRAENAMARAIRALGIPPGPAKPTEDFDAEMRRLAAPQEGAALSGASDPAEGGDDLDERMGDEMLPAEGVL